MKRIIALIVSLSVVMAAFSGVAAADIDSETDELETEYDQHSDLNTDYIIAEYEYNVSERSDSAEIGNFGGTDFDPHNDYSDDMEMIGVDGDGSETELTSGETVDLSLYDDLIVQVGSNSGADVYHLSEVITELKIFDETRELAENDVVDRDEDISITPTDGDIEVDVIDSDTDDLLSEGVSINQGESMTFEADVYIQSSSADTVNVDISTVEYLSVDEYRAIDPVGVDFGGSDFITATTADESVSVSDDVDGDIDKFEVTSSEAPEDFRFAVQIETETDGVVDEVGLMDGESYSFDGAVDPDNVTISVDSLHEPEFTLSEAPEDDDSVFGGGVVGDDKVDQNVLLGVSVALLAVLLFVAARD